MIESYLTLKQEAQDEYVVQKSRFIAYCSPVANEEEAKEKIALIRKKHIQATHNCFAYVIGTKSEMQRYSDDGEPSGTAGIPMLEVLKQTGVVNALAVVTRYFGGVLLGAGGLVRAYRKSTVLGLHASQIVRMRSTLFCEIDLAYNLWARFEKTLYSLDVIVDNIIYTDKVSLHLYVKCENYDEIKTSIVQFCEAKVSITHKAPFYYPWPEKQEILDE